MGRVCRNMYQMSDALTLNETRCSHLYNIYPAPAISYIYKVAIDQGSDGWSACNFLQWKLCCLLLIADPSHRCWNDAQLALGDAGMTSICMLCIIVLNLDHGP